MSVAINLLSDLMKFNLLECLDETRPAVSLTHSQRTLHHLGMATDQRHPHQY